MCRFSFRGATGQQTLEEIVSPTPPINEGDFPLENVEKSPPPVLETEHRVVAAVSPESASHTPSTTEPAVGGHSMPVLAVVSSFRRHDTLGDWPCGSFSPASTPRFRLLKKLLH